MTGARRGELCGLRWSDVDLDTGVVRIWRSIRQVGSRLIEGDTKTHQERIVALAPQAVDQLRRYRSSLGDLADDPFVSSRPRSIMGARIRRTPSLACSPESPQLLPACRITCTNYGTSLRLRWSPLAPIRSR